MGGFQIKAVRDYRRLDFECGRFTHFHAPLHPLIMSTPFFWYSRRLGFTRYPLRRLKNGVRIFAAFCQGFTSSVHSVIQDLVAGLRNSEREKSPWWKIKPVADPSIIDMT